MRAKTDRQLFPSPGVSASTGRGGDRHRSRHRPRPRSRLRPGAQLLIATLAAQSAGVVPSAAAAADGGRAVVHPIYAHVQDAPQNELAQQRFSAAARRFGLGPVEVVDVEGDPAPRPEEKLRAALPLVRKLDFEPALATLDQAAAEVAATGGGGLDAAALSDLFLFRAWAIGRFDFNPDRAPPLTARAQAYGELVRAAMLTPGRQFNAQQFPPLLLEDWARAVAELAARPQGTLTVRAAPEATVSCDGGKPVAGPATFVGLAQGDHLIRVDEPGWAAWGTTVSITAAVAEVEVPPRRALTLDDAGAAARARRMGMKFALVAEPRPGRDGGLTLGLRLVDIAGVRHDAVIQSLAGDVGALEAAIMRLDEQARRLDRASAGAAPPPPFSPSGGAPALGAPGLGAPGIPADATLPPPVFLPPPPAPARFSDDPAAWARGHWPLLTAVGVLVGAAIILSATVDR